LVAAERTDGESPDLVGCVMKPLLALSLRDSASLVGEDVMRRTASLFGTIVLLSGVAAAAPKAQIPSTSGDTAVHVQTTIGGPYDSLVRIGFGSFAKLPSQLRRCVSQRSPVDTLVYGLLGIDREVTGDFYGLEISFQVVADSLRGYVRIGEGPLTGPFALESLDYDTQADSLHSWYTEGGRERFALSMRVTCSGLSGTTTAVVVPSPTYSDSGSSVEPLLLARAPHQYVAPR